MHIKHLPAPLKGLAVFGSLVVGALALPVMAHASVTVQSGDTLSGLFPTNWPQVCDHNAISDCNLIYPEQVIRDLNEEGLQAVSEPVQVAADTQPVVEEKVELQVAPVRSSGGANTYAYGWCTWWVKEKRPDIGSYWGNAGYNWLTAAQRAGFGTGSNPAAGAIGVMTGHVVYIESVSGNMVNLSEMGWNYVPGVVHYRTVPASSFTYIY